MVDAVAEPPGDSLSLKGVSPRGLWAYLAPLKGTRVGRSPTRGMDVCDISLIKL